VQCSHLKATACDAMLAVNGAMMKPSRSLMFTKVRFAESASELKVYLRQQRMKCQPLAVYRL
jgi:hypothetical protein